MMISSLRSAGFRVSAALILTVAALGAADVRALAGSSPPASSEAALARIPAYDLPYDPEHITNCPALSQKLNLSPSTMAHLRNHGFAVFPTPRDIAEDEFFLHSSRRTASPRDDFVAYYQAIQDRDLPLFVTSDSVLHYAHIIFDTVLTRLERDLLYHQAWHLTRGLLQESLQCYHENTGDVKEAARRNVVYFSVALTLLAPTPDQVAGDARLREEYCYPDMPDDYCEMVLQGVKEQFGEAASYRYFAEADLARYQAEIPALVRDQVAGEISLIKQHEGWAYSPLFLYREDYSQYVPRGHYTQSEKLKDYFQAMMWYGRMTFLIHGSPALSPGVSRCSGDPRGIISTYDAKIQTLQACLITRQLQDSERLQQHWRRLYGIPGFFVGHSDDLGPDAYQAVLEQAMPADAPVQDYGPEYHKLADLLTSLPWDPRIYSGLGGCQLLMPCPPLTREDLNNLTLQADALLQATKGFRLVGQRFTVDSWVFSRIVSPYSGEYTGPPVPLPTDQRPFTFRWNDPYPSEQETRPFTWVRTKVEACPPPGTREVRGFPRGLDLMALWGSSRAEEILRVEGDTAYSDYEERYSLLDEQLGALRQKAPSTTLYLGWLHALDALFRQYGTGYQTFMQTDAWQKKALQTALASWTELRHDTALYVKQSYTMAEMGAAPAVPVAGYVEPVPELYRRLGDLVGTIQAILPQLLTAEQLEDVQIDAALKMFSRMLSTLEEISCTELINQPLTEEEYAFIEDFGTISESLINTVSGGQVGADAFRTTMTADVHTDGNTGMVLQEAVGEIDTLIAAYQLPADHVLAGVGPVFSYYEFKQPMEERLTDEAWRDMLGATHPQPPAWTRAFKE